MTILNQKTIKTPIHVNGVGLHTGKKVDVKILPSEPNSGILFKRVDINHKNLIVPNYMNVCDTNLCTTIQNENGMTLLHHAAVKDQTVIFRKLIRIAKTRMLSHEKYRQSGVFWHAAQHSAGDAM